MNNERVGPMVGFHHTKIARHEIVPNLAVVTVTSVAAGSRQWARRIFDGEFDPGSG